MLKRTGTIVDFWIDRQVGRMKYAECSSVRFQDQVQVLCWVQQLWPGKQRWSLTAPFSRSWPAGYHSILMTFNRDNDRQARRGWLWTASPGPPSTPRPSEWHFLQRFAAPTFLIRLASVYFWLNLVFCKPQFLTIFHPGGDEKVGRRRRRRGSSWPCRRWAGGEEFAQRLGPQQGEHDVVDLLIDGNDFNVSLVWTAMKLGLSSKLFPRWIKTRKGKENVLLRRGGEGERWEHSLSHSWKLFLTPIQRWESAVLRSRLRLRRRAWRSFSRRQPLAQPSTGGPSVRRRFRPRLTRRRKRSRKLKVKSEPLLNISNFTHITIICIE